MSLPYTHYKHRTIVPLHKYVIYKHTHSSGRLAADSVEPEHLVRNLAFHVDDVEPGHVARRVVRRGDRALPLRDDERVRVALEVARGREVPLGAQTRTVGVRHEVVLGEDLGRVDLVEEVDDGLDGPGDELPDVVQVVLDGGEAGIGRQARRVDDLCDGANGPACVPESR